MDPYAQATEWNMHLRNSVISLYTKLNTSTQLDITKNTVLQN